VDTKGNYTTVYDKAQIVIHPADKSRLDELTDTTIPGATGKTSGELGALDEDDPRAENYAKYSYATHRSDIWDAFVTRYKEAQRVLAAASPTQQEVDDAYDALEQAWTDVQAQDHPALDSLHNEVPSDIYITTTGIDYEMHVKGYIGSLTTSQPFDIDGKAYNVGITAGSAIVNLSAAITDPLANGVYAMNLHFADGISTGTATVALHIDRTPPAPNDTGALDGTAPQTGDNPAMLYMDLAIAAALVCIGAFLIIVAIRRRRKRKDEDK
jgi:hypothetical protein